MNDILLENARFALRVGGDGRVKSLILKASGEELLDTTEPCSLCSVTQARPYNNEIKLAHPNKRTTFSANSVTRDKADPALLHVTFETVPVKANVRIRVTDEYISFTLEGFTVAPEDYGNIRITPPPVVAFRLLQLPVRLRKNFGEWMNVLWDDSAACCVMSATPYLRADSEPRRDSRILYAEALCETGLTARPAVLFASESRELLDCVDAMERDFDLPRGVQSRRGKDINASVYWVSDASPDTIDAHIRYAKSAGLRMMLFYYTCFFDEYGCYSKIGNYDYLPAYPNGAESVRVLLEKVKAAGITPGLHVLHTHIGMASRYVTPRVDPRLHLDRIFTLAKPLTDSPDDAGDLYVLQNPAGARMAAGTRILKFGTELISYEGYTDEPPYRFTGCVRGDHATDIVTHPAGEMGGILDVSEFGAGSCYIDQDSNLQDEIAEKIAALYNAGFAFMYFDGSEGAIPPYEIHIPAAQYRVLRKFKNPPLFCEGAAKAHFSWHFMSGGNAFDVFPPDVFKQRIDEHPAAEAPRMACDFTRLDFGWWFFWSKATQPDHYEYATSHAAAWNCPATMMANLPAFADHARTPDIFEVLRRWEDVRAREWLSDAQKILLRQPGHEYHLLINQAVDYELVPVTRLHGAASDPLLRVFTFERNGHAWALFWHAEDRADYVFPFGDTEVQLYGNTLDKGQPCAVRDGQAAVTAAGVGYIETDLTIQELTDVLKQGRLAADTADV